MMSPRAAIRPIETPIPADRQGVRRHYGVHPYFTRRPFNVVRKYVLHYSREGDRVLDPFGGSGVTAIEAFLENRVGIQNDINPLANFIAKGIAGLRHGARETYRAALATLQDKCERRLSQIEAAEDAAVSRMLKRLALPPNVELPRNSDVERYHDLFLPKQLAALAVLKEAIDALENRDARKGMLLAWSATVTKLNKTFLSAEGRLESRGGSSVFSIYRFKVAKRPVSLPAWRTFQERALNVIAAKEEIDKSIEVKRAIGSFSGEFQVYAKDVEELAAALDRKVDYIFTDPPYGGHISYLDLSTLWNGWLGELPSRRLREKELIVGGDLGLPEATYVDRLGRSIRACVRMLKPGRWMSVVFQHWNTAYFDAILTAAAESGLELRGAISQVGDPVWSMHKKKGSESVLAGEMILTFFSSGKVQNLNEGRGFDVSRAVGGILNSIGSGHVYGEYLFNRVVMEAWEQGTISSLHISRTDFVDLIRRQGWHYDRKNHYWVRGRAAEGLPFDEVGRNWDDEQADDDKGVTVGARESEDVD